MPEAGSAGQYSSLCRPDADRTCFRCCPPIRPAGYDHLDHRSSLRRALIENTSEYRDGSARKRPIAGFSCWGLGFLDGGWSKIGCLLHPAQNDGRDLRDATGYGDKCRRELCREARAYQAFPIHLRGFLLGFSAGLDSFEYSSPKANPVFRLIGWGPAVIEGLWLAESGSLSVADYRDRWPALAVGLNPDRDRFPLEVLLRRHPLAEISTEAFLARYRPALETFIADRSKMTQPPYDRRPRVHELNLPEGFIRFLRAALGRNRATQEESEEILEMLERMIGGLTPEVGAT